MSNEENHSIEEVLPFIRIYVSYGKKNNDLLELDQVVGLLTSEDGPASHIKELIDKGMINIYACCFDKVAKVL